MDRHVLVAEGIPPWLAVWWRLFTWWFMVGIGSLVWLPSPEILKTRVWLYLHHSFIIPSSGEWLALLLKGWSGWGSLMVTGSGFIALKLPMNDGAGITLLSPSLAWPRGCQFWEREAAAEGAAHPGPVGWALEASVLLLVKALSGGFFSVCPRALPSHRAEAGSDWKYFLA